MLLRTAFALSIMLSVTPFRGEDATPRWTVDQIQSFFAKGIAQNKPGEKPKPNRIYSVGEIVAKFGKPDSTRVPEEKTPEKKKTAGAPTAAEKATIKKYFDGKIGDPDYKVVEWSDVISGKNGGCRIFAKLRYITEEGGWKLDIWSVDLNNGEVVSAMGRLPAFPGSPEEDAQQAFKDMVSSMARGENLGPKPRIEEWAYKCRDGTCHVLFKLIQPPAPPLKFRSSRLPGGAEVVTPVTPPVRTDNVKLQIMSVTVDRGNEKPRD